MTIATSTDSAASANTERDDPRWRAIAAPFGIASLAHTHWLDAVPRAYEGVSGLWASIEGRVVGAGVDPREADAANPAPADISLAPGDEVRVGRVLLRAIGREGSLALRILDPDAPTRTQLRGILSFPRDERWVVPGVFRPAVDGETRVVRLVDGYEKEEQAVGVVEFELDGQPVALTVSRAAAGFSAVIADGTSNVDAYRFRFLPIAAAADDGTVTVDFNRAYLPPCAFSDQYVCPLPPANNRLTLRVEAGERLVDRG